ncbi:MAG: hypothetical protein P1V20_23685 [Verrucomicrobiales bacterium]|nr:hypothetical protein [Verrucomicrobiales bacterium]
MPPFKSILVLFFPLLLSQLQAQNPYAQPEAGTQQGTVPDSTGYSPPPNRVQSLFRPGRGPNLNNQPGTEEPVQEGDAPLIDLTSKDSPPPVAAATDSGSLNPPVPAEDMGNGSKMGARVSRSRVIEEYRPEKFKVYPDDPESAVWETNVRYAFSRAKREMKPLLLLFTAVWRPEAMDLSQEVFSTKSFNNFVKENLVICYLNYPPNVRDAPKSMQWAKKEFKVAGYPSVLIFSPKGDVERSLRGYRKGRPVDYFNNLKQACAPTLTELKMKKDSFARHGYREWRNSEGKGLFAKFVRRDDYLMTLRDATGREWTIAISQLAAEDRQMARSFPRLDQVVKLTD